MASPRSILTVSRVRSRFDAMIKNRVFQQQSSEDIKRLRNKESGFQARKLRSITLAATFSGSGSTSVGV